MEKNRKSPLRPLPRPRDGFFKGKFPVGYEGVKTKEQLAENLEETRKCFFEKDAMLQSGLGIAATESIEVDEYVWWLFDRDTKFEKDVQPFEEERSEEYQIWLKQKRAHVEEFDYTDYGCWRYNPVIFYKDYDKLYLNESNEVVPGNRHRLLLKDDEKTLSFLRARKFALLSPVTYVGRNNTATNARYLYAFAVDLDGVGVKELQRLFGLMTNGFVPAPNLISNSGHGLHLYYILEEPVALFEDNIKLLNKMKHGLTNCVWIPKTTSSIEKRQYQGVLQGFRVPGTLTKFGEVIRCYRLPDVPLWTLKKVNDLLDEDGSKLTSEEMTKLKNGTGYNPTGVRLAEAEKQWPEWYFKKIVEGRHVLNKWHIKRDLYDWWLNKLSRFGEHPEVQIHHRYWCILALVAFAVKCDVSREEVLEDALALVPFFDSLTDDETNHFTNQDVYDALKSYNVNHANWPISWIERTTGIQIKKNIRKNNGREKHLMIMQFQRDMIKFPDGGWRKGNGRKKGSVVVADDSRCSRLIVSWRQEHPGSKNKSQCARDLGLSRPTVTKWWEEKDQCAEQVAKWQLVHPGLKNKSQCARDLGLSRPTVSKWWVCN